MSEEGWVALTAGRLVGVRIKALAGAQGWEDIEHV
jgi:hypothetical protein